MSPFACARDEAREIALQFDLEMMRLKVELYNWIVNERFNLQPQQVRRFQDLIRNSNCYRDLYLGIESAACFMAISDPLQSLRLIEVVRRVAA